MIAEKNNLSVKSTRSSSIAFRGLWMGVVLALITASLLVLVKLGGEWAHDLRGLLIVISGMTALASLDAFSRFLER
jgi:flagellar biogenesis protein FliO